MTPKKGLAVISEVFNLSYTEIAEKIGRSKQEVSMWANGKRAIPKKWCEELNKIDEFAVFKEFPDFLQSDLSELDEIDVQIAYYDFLATKEGITGDYSHPYYQKMGELQDQMSRMMLMDHIEHLLDDPELAAYFDYLELLKRVNFIIQVKKIGRMEALDSMIRLLTEDVMDPDFDINDEDDFTKELQQLLEKYKLLEEIPVIDLTPRDKK